MSVDLSDLALKEHLSQVLWVAVLEQRGDVAPGAARALDLMSSPPKTRMDYLSALKLTHQILEPANYCEIGCRNGHSLALSGAPSVGVDPDPTITNNDLPPRQRIIRMTSDDFFAEYDPTQLLGAPIDFAFIDGMHRVEFALRDFMNLEKNASPQSVIAVDDILPDSMEWTSRDQTPGNWCGDVYRLIPLLRHYRPDLSVKVYDINVKGYALISRLNPGSTLLTENYVAIERELTAGRWRKEYLTSLRCDAAPLPAERLEGDLKQLAAWRDLLGALAPIGFQTQ